MQIKEIMASLKEEEGYSQFAYHCSEGRLTIAHGRMIESGGIGISEEEADYLLQNDIKRSFAECQNFSWFDSLPDDKKMVLVELCFQLGYPTLCNFNRMLTGFSKRDWATAAVELLDSKYAREQCPARAKRLSQRLHGI